MSWGLTFLAYGQGVIDQMFVPEIFALPAPMAGLFQWGHVSFALDGQAKIPIILKTGFKLIFIYMLYHDGMVLEQLEVIIWVVM